jgi:hypothetical protein
LTPPGSLNGAVFTIARLVAMVMAMGRTVDDLVGLTNILVAGKGVAGAQPYGLAGHIANLATPLGNRHSHGSGQNATTNGQSPYHSTDGIQTPTPRQHFTNSRGGHLSRGGAGGGRGAGNYKGRKNSSSVPPPPPDNQASSSSSAAKKRKPDIQEV